jgi:hypothetical protein
MKNFSLINFIRSNNFALTCAILSVLVQSFHSFYAFYNMSSLRGSAWGIVQAVLFAIVVDLAILFYTVRGKKDVVMFASAFLFIINGYYYFSHFGVSYELVFAGFLSILIPVTQYYYSEEIKDDVSDVEYEDKIDGMNATEWKSTYDIQRQKTESLIQTIKSLEGIIRNGKSENERLCGRIDEELQKNQIIAKQYNEASAYKEKLSVDRDGLLMKVNAMQQVNSKIAEVLGERDREIFELKKRVGDLPQDAELDPDEKIQEIEDKTLLNVHDGAYNPTTSVTPVTE